MTGKRGRPRKRSPEPETWEVEAIRSHWPVDASRNDPGSFEKLFYNVIWKLKPGQIENWDEEENWIPESSMNCAALLDSYWKQVYQDRNLGRAPLVIEPPSQIQEYIDGIACPTLYFPEITTKKPNRRRSTAKKSLSNDVQKKPRKSKVKQTARSMSGVVSQPYTPSRESNKLNYNPAIITLYDSNSPECRRSCVPENQNSTKHYISRTPVNDCDNSSSESTDNREQNVTHMDIMKKPSPKRQRMSYTPKKHPERARSINNNRCPVDYNAGSIALENSTIKNLKAQVEKRKSKAGTYKAKESLLSEHMNERSGYPPGRNYHNFSKSPSNKHLVDDFGIDDEPANATPEKIVTNQLISPSMFFKYMESPMNTCCKLPVHELATDEDFADVSSVRSDEGAWSETDMTPLVAVNNQIEMAANVDMEKVELEDGEILENSEGAHFDASVEVISDSPERVYRPEVSTENLLFMLNNINFPGSQMILREFAKECWERKYDALNMLTPIFVITFLGSPRGEEPADWSMTVFENRPGYHPKHVCECVPTEQLWVVAPELVTQAEDRMAKIADKLPQFTNS